MLLGPRRCCVLLMNYYTGGVGGNITRHVSTTNTNKGGYKSCLSLDKIYPNNNNNNNDNIPQPPKNEGLNFSGYIPMDKVEVKYSRSSGPGGQNVNKVNTKVDLRFHLHSADWLSPQLREKLAEKYKGSITGEGYLVVRSDRTRSQQLNLADTLDKLRHMVHNTTITPTQPSYEAVERNRRRHEAAVRERLRQKREHSLTKQGRKEPEYI
ncbi:hypothetical protein Pmani_004931 [Petrolisthes manimaculis]|uniref:Large ribosomal subunit protein mL62 n=1 Tax=Petrolisthes manimaculis TaxID=1843537 RepID=A0AAE1QD91_9EUCA|nr:hypothetical protein Pmani_004931 [Petrolisthes manimaculis]